MQLEKQKGNTQWYKHNDLRLRIIKSKENKTLLWVCDDYVNLCLTLIMNDFITRCEDNGILLNIDTSWDNHKGFIYESESEILIGEIICFVDEFEIEKNEKADIFSKEEWYS